jgi:hypothetical protein
MVSALRQEASGPARACGDAPHPCTRAANENPIACHLIRRVAGPFEFATTLSQSNGRHTEVRWTGTCETVAGAKILRGLMLDITELRRLNRELAAAQKLESVGEGTLRFETECGKGTTFFIRLPIDAPIDASDAAQVAA